MGLVCTIAVVLLGPMAGSRVDTRGMDRNVITALIGSGLPRVAARAGAGDWRESRFQTDRATEDLVRFAGSARGLNVVIVSLESTAAQYLPLYGAPDDGGHWYSRMPMRFTLRASRDCSRFYVPRSLL